MKIIAQGQLKSRRSQAVFRSAENELHSTHVYPFQPIVWISLVLGTPRACPESAPRVPAVLDSGCTLDCLANFWHFKRWFHIAPKTLKQVREQAIFVHGQPVFFFGLVSLWIHKSQDSPHSSAHRLLLPLGIAIGDVVVPSRQTPNLGLRAWLIRRYGRSIPTFDPSVNVPQDFEIDEFALQNYRKERSVPARIYPRLPLIGLSALANSGLTLEFKPSAFTLFTDSERVNPSAS
ncbi:hypothetical protein SH449x_000202 [Pirellulaceae bacterium SH449]